MENPAAIASKEPDQNALMGMQSQEQAEQCRSVYGHTRGDEHCSDAALRPSSSIWTGSSILIVKLRHHGDVLLTTPVARALKEIFPTCQVDFLVYEGMEALLKNNPDITRIWTWNRSLRGGRGLWKHLQLFSSLWKQHYDVVLHLSEQMQGALLARLLRPRYAIGMDYPKRRDFFWRSCFTHLIPLFPSDTRHTVEQHVAALEPLGIKVAKEQAHCRLVVNILDRDTIQQHLRKAAITSSYIVIHPTARWFFKCWEDDRFAALIQQLADQGWPIIVTSSPEQQEMMMIASILRQINSPRVLSLAGQLTLSELAALIEGARLFVGVDSVPMHMAAALGKDTVALFGPSKIQEWHPWMTRSIVIRASDYGPLIDPDTVLTDTRERYLSNISVEAVMEAIGKMLNKSEELPGKE